jgi:ATPase subunit of ABC transporter with duplicated ATPase domains
VGDNQIVGIAGPNGAGKSTLFKLLMREEHPKEGEIIIDGSIVLVPQEIKYDPNLEKSLTVREYLDEHYLKEDREIIAMLHGLEMRDIQLYESPHGLSGGQKTKLAIIRALLLEPDILLLDEPTNFLDTKGKIWVSKFLADYPKTLLLISHDLKLMDSSIDKVITLNPAKAQIEEYKGNYSQYLKLKEQHDALLTRQIVNETKHVKRMEKSLVGLMSRKSEKGVRQRVQLQKRIERIKESLPPLPKEARGIKVTLPIPQDMSDIPVRVNGISKAYGDKTIVEDFTLIIRKAEKIALVGQNGAGKSTFIKMMVGVNTPDTGEIIKAEKLKIGYYSQELEALDFSKNLIETISEVKAMPIEKIRAHLSAFLFSGDRVFQKVGSLSGGEKTRLSIALLLLENYNMLILDEPTTYLDVLSQRIILEAIKRYTGTILIVSHTEDFIKELVPDRAILLPEQKVVNWEDELLEKVSLI